MNTIQPIAFAFDDAAVRIVPDAERPLFVAKDVCTVLGIINSRDAISELDDDEKVTLSRKEAENLTVGNTDGQNLHSRGGAQYINLITESGLYALVFKSRKPDAKRFRKWVTSEVLPSIRKNGAYGALKPADEIRYLNQRLQLLRELNKVRDPLTREKVFEQFKHVSDKLGFDTPSLDAFRTPHGNDALDEGTRLRLSGFLTRLRRWNALILRLIITATRRFSRLI